MQIALNEAKLSEEKVKSELRHVQEENARLKKSKEQVSYVQARQLCSSFERSILALFLLFLSIASVCPSFLNSTFHIIKINLKPLVPACTAFCTGESRVFSMKALPVPVIQFLSATSQAFCGQEVAI